MDELINLTDAFLLKLKQKSEEIILANIDSEIGYIFTNDDHYLEHRTRLIPSHKENRPGQQQQQGKGKPQKQEDGADGDKPAMDARTGKAAQDDGAGRPERRIESR